MAGIGSLKLALDPEDRAALMLLRDALSEATHELRRYNDSHVQSQCPVCSPRPLRG